MYVPINSEHFPFHFQNFPRMPERSLHHCPITMNWLGKQFGLFETSVHVKADRLTERNIEDMLQRHL